LIPNTRKILIVDDDPELRDALTEQLSLHEEFEAVAAENGSKGVLSATTSRFMASAFVFMASIRDRRPSAKDRERDELVF
jgi:DNA-binding response OmpR family regulator